MGAFVLEIIYWEAYGFRFNRILELIRIPYVSVVCYFTARALKNGKVNIDPSIIEAGDATRLFMTMAVFLAVWFVANFSVITVVVYFGSGLMHSAVNIATYYMGQMTDFYDLPLEETDIRRFPKRHK